MKFRIEGIYDARKLGIPQMLILGLQHMFAMFGATILVPILVNNYFHGEGLTVQVTLFCARFRYSFIPRSYKDEGSRFSWLIFRSFLEVFPQLQSLIPVFSKI